MLAEGLILPRMKALETRQMFFHKKKREVEHTFTAQKTQQPQRQEDDFVPYYLQTLNKIKRSKKIINTINQQAAQPAIYTNKYTPSGSCDIHSQSSIESKTKHLSFRIPKPEERQKSLNNYKKDGDSLHIVISNGCSHDKVLPEKDKKRVNFTRFKRYKERSSLTFRTLEAKTSRDRQQSTTIQDIGFDDIISKTKYLHQRLDKKHYLQEFETTNFESKIKELTPRKPYIESFASSSLQAEQPLKTEQEMKYQNLQRKYKSLIQGFSTVSKVKHPKQKVESQKDKKRDKKVKILFNTLELSGW